MVRNSGFENGNDGSWLLLKGGQPTGSDFGNEGHSGSRCYRFRFARNPLLGAFLGLRQQVRLCAKTRYILRAWTKRPLARTSCVADFYVDGKVIASSANGNTGDWVETVSKGAFLTGDSENIDLSIKITCSGFLNGGPVELLLDDISFEAAVGV